MTDSKPVPVDAMAAFLQGVCELSQCRMAVALWQRAPHEVAALCSVPSIQLGHAPVWRWQLPHSPSTNSDCNVVQRLSRRQLPSLVTAGLPFSPGAVVYVDCSAFGKISTGGFVMVWEENHPSQQCFAETDPPGMCGPLNWLRPVYGQLLDARQWEGQTADSAAQFHQIFDSVPHGIVVLSARNEEAQINEAAGHLLRLPSGSVPADLLARAMRETRTRCENATELDRAYLPLQSDLDTKLVVDWHLNESVWRVDTHPILQSGNKGRVWLFQDITAQVRLERVLRMEANHDLLTGLFSRRAFVDRAQVAFQTPHNGDGKAHQLALVIFDIDHFKQVNDLHGHSAGDQVLKEVAYRAKSVLREGDLLARYGGEEFVVLLTETHPGAACAAAERLRAVVDSHPVKLNESLVTVSISVGLTFRHGRSETLQQTIERADSNLYQAKRRGRNQVVSDGD